VELIGLEPFAEFHLDATGSLLADPEVQRFTRGPVPTQPDFERNLQFYDRHGFDVAVEGVEPTSGLGYWCLVRLPEASRAASA
jgi:hypothetical protein